MDEDVQVLIDELTTLRNTLAKLTHRIPDRLQDLDPTDQSTKRLYYLKWAKAQIGTAHSILSTGLEYLGQALNE